MSGNKTAFVAYPSQDQSLQKILEEGVRQANAVDANPVFYKPWVFNDIAGRPLVDPIHANIDNSKYIVADVTYLNLNVVYEIGYAIGRQKKVQLIRCGEIGGDVSLAKEAGIFDTLGYKKYGDSEDLERILISKISEDPYPVTSELDRRAPLYIVEPPKRTQAATVIASRTKKSGYRYRSFMPSEEPRLSAIDAIRQVGISSGVILHLQQDAISEAAVHNVRTLFVYGLAIGMGKPTLLMADYSANIPLDVRDAVEVFKHTDDIVEHIADFCPKINQHLQNAEPTKERPSNLLDQISVGDPTAENEMATLEEYFLSTDEYNRALRGEVNLVTGRKGSGKTALFVMIRNKLRRDKRNIVVDLKPEGYQLIKLKENILKYLSRGSQQHLIIAFWEYLILLEVAYKILEKDKKRHKNDHLLHDLYQELEEAYEVDDFASDGDFSERLLTLSQRLSENFSQKFGCDIEQNLTASDVTELVYTHDLKKLKERVSKYLEHKGDVWVLFDNLDKGWATDGIDIVDTTVLRCLIDASRKIERSMHKDRHGFKCIVFVRNDVYELLMANSADYAKDMRTALDWKDQDLLRELLRLRLVNDLPSKHQDDNFMTIWKLICTSHVRGEESSQYVIERSLMRPRNVIKIFAHARGHASNFRRKQIGEEDFEKGMKNYSQDILIELGKEMNDVFPESKDVIYNFLGEKNILSKISLDKVLDKTEIDDDQKDKIIQYLLYYGVLGIIHESRELYIFDFGYDIKLLNMRSRMAGDDLRYIINPAFNSVLQIQVQHLVVPIAKSTMTTSL
nr:hypothetical protein [uncultured Cohaesibacter sp.]